MHDLGSTSGSPNVSGPLAHRRAAVLSALKGLCPDAFWHRALTIGDFSPGPPPHLHGSKSFAKEVCETKLTPTKYPQTKHPNKVLQHK